MFLVRHHEEDIPIPEEICTITSAPGDDSSSKKHKRSKGSSTHRRRRWRNFRLRLARPFRRNKHDEIHDKRRDVVDHDSLSNGSSRSDDSSTDVDLNDEQELTIGKNEGGKHLKSGTRSTVFLDPWADSFWAHKTAIQFYIVVFAAMVARDPRWLNGISLLLILKMVVILYKWGVFFRKGANYVHLRR